MPPDRPIDPRARLTESITGGASVAVDGAEDHQRALGVIVNAQPHRCAPHAYAMAQLVPDPGHPTDPAALAVFIGEHHVGHVESAGAAVVAPVVEELLELDRVATCPAIITGGTGSSWGPTHYGVSLNIGSRPRLRTNRDPVLVSLHGRLRADVRPVCRPVLERHAGQSFMAHLSPLLGAEVEVVIGRISAGCLPADRTEPYHQLVTLLHQLAWPTTVAAHLTPTADGVALELALPVRDELVSVLASLELLTGMAGRSGTTEAGPVDEPGLHGAGGASAHARTA